MDPAQSGAWMASDTSMSYKGDTLVSFGIGIDLAHDLSGYKKENLDALYYANPGKQGRVQGDVPPQPRRGVPGGSLRWLA